VKLSFAFSVGCGKQHAEGLWSLIERECGLSIRLPDEWLAWTSSHSGAAYSLCGGRASIAAQEGLRPPDSRSPFSQPNKCRIVQSAGFRPHRALTGVTMTKAVDDRHGLPTWALVTAPQWQAVSELGDLPPMCEGSVQLWLLPLLEPSCPLDDLMNLLNDEEQKRAARFQFENDRRAFVVSHGLLRMLLGARLGLAPADVPIVQEPGEKPLLAGAGELDFNLSHSGEWGLVGLATTDIGVDIEMVRPMSDRDHIAKRFFAPSETAALAALPEAEREDGFFACWTRKEAYVKARGLGLTAPLDGFEVTVEPRASPALLTIGGSREDAVCWSLWGGRPAAGVFAAAAIRRPHATFRLYRLEPSTGLLETARKPLQRA
jgi:4'-phosphopantetheinyl transferase